MKKIYILLIATTLYYSFANAQFSDNFSDGDLTANPIWSGDMAEYQVNASLQMHLNAPAVANVSHLSTPSVAISNAVWEFYVQMNFNPSSTNYSKVYLVSNQANLESPLNGYFVKLGNTADEVSLYRQTGTTETLIIDGVNGRLNTAQVTTSVRVTRDNAGNWQLFSDTTGGTTYFLEGSVLDNTYTSSSFFGVSSTYTSTRSTLFFYDNFNVTGTAVLDVTAPTIDSVVVLNATNLDVYFNEPVNLATAQTLTNYAVNLSIGNPSSSVRDLSDSSLVHLTFTTPFVANQSYNLTTINVEDTISNAITSIVSPFIYVVIVIPNKGDVVINEIFADPTPQVGLPTVEFVELYNASTTAYNLQNWKFINTTTAQNLPNFLLQPNSYVTLCLITDTALFSPFGSVIGLSSFTALTNGGDSLSLLDNNNQIIDIVNYDISWYQDAIKDDGGWTLERINPNTLCSNASNWIASVNPIGGTPGTQNSVFNNTPDTQSPVISSVNINSLTQIELLFNEPMDSLSLATATYTLTGGISVVNTVIATNLQSVVINLTPAIDSTVLYTVRVLGSTDCSGNVLNPDSIQFIKFIAPTPVNKGDVVINEIFADPTPQVGLPTVEFVELYNASTTAYNLQNWKFVNTTTAQNLPNFLLQPNSYVTLCLITDTALFSPFGNVIGLSSFTALTNGGDSLSLLSSNSQIIDIVTYDISWYQDAIKDDGGWTLERINPNTLCSNSSNWTASTNLMGGTPGTLNSVFDTLPDTQSPNIINVEHITSTKIQVLFSEAMDSLSLATAIYTITGGITITNVTILSDLKSVFIDFTPALDSSTVYTVQIQNALDCSGNILNPNTFSFGIGKTPQKFEVIITELFPDPEPSLGLPESEYLELFNNTPNIIDLTGSSLSDLSTAVEITDGKILPGEYVIICSKSVENQFTPFGKVITVSTLPSLNNASDRITLKNTKSETVHFVAYFDSWYRDNIKKDGGWSLEMIDPNNPCGEANNWIASTKWFGGTPGTQNTANGINPDVFLPKLIEANALTDSTVQLTFDEVLDSIAMLAASYTIDHAINIASIQKIDDKNVLLRLANKLIFKIIYKVTVVGALDCVGNAIGTDNNAIFALPEQGFNGDLIINEVLFNPFVGGSDFVEIYNNSNKFINLQNWYLANADNDSISNKRIIITKPRLMLPGDFVVFTVNTANVATEYLNAKINTFIEMPSVPAYNDGDGTVVLLNNLSMKVDSFSYNSAMHFSLLNDLNGVSLERIDYNRPTNDKTNWHSAAEDVGFATPGFENSQFQQVNTDGDEITISPSTFSPNNDGIDDVLNISYNFPTAGFVANVMIYDAKGREIRNLLKNELLGTKGTFSWDGINDDKEKARIGIYVIYIEVFKLDGTTKTFKKTAVLAGRFD